jgi:hypothetical protein
MTNFSVQISIDASSFGYTSEIRNQTNLCQFRSLSFAGATDDDMYIPACPLQEGPYELFTSFNVPQFFKDDELDFTPDLHIEFYDGITLEQIGCVETGTLAQMAINLRLQKRGERFFVMCIFIFISVFAICLIGHRRRRQAGVNAQANKKASIIRRFHYRRTARNGTVLIPNTNNNNAPELGSTTVSAGLREVT